jgi:hypothetical protein
LDLRKNLLVLREPAYVVLAPNLRAVDVNVEDAAGAFDQLRINAELLLDCFRQTGGCRKVVSLHAILDRDVHLGNLLLSEPQAPARGRKRSSRFKDRRAKWCVFAQPFFEL